jgi:hypothetical protein
MLGEQRLGNNWRFFTPFGNDIGAKNLALVINIINRPHARPSRNEPWKNLFVN